MCVQSPVAGSLARIIGHIRPSPGRCARGASPPHSAPRAHLAGEGLMCPMIRANEPATGLCTRIGPIRACAPNATCLRPCVTPVVVMTPPHPGSPVPPKMTLRGRCVMLGGVNPGGPMIPAGSAGASGSAAGSPPAFKP